MEALDLHRAGVEFARSVVAGIGDDQWDLPTPCTDWNVRDLVNHLVSEDLWVPELMAGKTIDDVGDRFTGDVIGDDPVAAQHASSGAAQEAFDGGSLDQIVHLSFGDVPARILCVQRASDLVVHGWDVAAATGQDADVDPAVTDALYAINEPMITPEVRQMGIFGPAVEVGEDASSLDRLVAFLGRDPEFSNG